MLLSSGMAVKNFGIRIRVDKELRDAFQAACMAENLVASDVLREFMRSFADRSFNGRQQSLFFQGLTTDRPNSTGKTSTQ